jgi:hypothetical protein
MGQLIRTKKTDGTVIEIDETTIKCYENYRDKPDTSVLVVNYEGRLEKIEIAETVNSFISKIDPEEQPSTPIWQKVFAFFL